MADCFWILGSVPVCGLYYIHFVLLKELSSPQADGRGRWKGMSTCFLG